MAGGIQVLEPANANMVTEARSLVAIWVVLEVRVPFWGPVYKGAVLFWGPRRGPLSYLNPYQPFELCPGE